MLPVVLSGPPQIPGAMHALMFAKEVFGDTSIELTPSYLVLAEANLGEPLVRSFRLTRLHGLLVALPSASRKAGSGRPWRGRASRV